MQKNRIINLVEVGTDGQWKANSGNIFSHRIYSYKCENASGEAYTYLPYPADDVNYLWFSLLRLFTEDHELRSLSKLPRRGQPLNCSDTWRQMKFVYAPYSVNHLYAKDFESFNWNRSVPRKFFTMTASSVKSSKNVPVTYEKLFSNEIDGIVKPIIKLKETYGDARLLYGFYV
jgi:hypothetical protein